MRILITGGAGFLGSNLIRYLLKRYPGYDLINLDRLTYTGNLENLQDIAHLPMYHFVQGDICNEVEVDAMMGQQIDVLIHLAAEPFPNPEEQDPSRFIRTDVFGTYVLARAASAYKISRFIHVSTADIYGIASARDMQRPVDEHEEPKPGTAHVAAQLAAERLAYSYYVSHNLPVTIARPTTVFGPYQYPDYSVAQYVVRAMLQEPVVLPQDGRGLRDWLYIDDFCTAIDQLLHARRRDVEGQVFNIGTGHQRAHYEVVELLLHIMDRSPRLIHLSDEHGRAEQLPVDISKIERLGWQAATDFHRAIGQTIQWYQDHPDWWEKLRHPSMITTPLSFDDDGV